MRLTADLVFKNGQVITMNASNQIAEALAVKGNKILHVGNDSEAEELLDKSTRVIDLKGKSLIPGFIDSHLHMGFHGTIELGLNLRYPNVKSIEDIKNAVRKAAESAEPGSWIRGWGYDQSKLNEKRHPNKWDLDEVAPHNPVILTRTCGHISANNSLSMELGGIKDDTPNPKGGEIVKENGKATGVMKEIAHQHLLKNASFPEDEWIKALEIADKQFVKMGITSIHDAGGDGATQMRAMQKGCMAEKINVRINAMVFSLDDNMAFIGNFLKTGIFTGFGNEKFKIGPMKIMIDGSSSGPTSATREPYTSNPNDTGILCMSEEEVDETIINAHSLGFQVTAHAVGDKAVEMMVNSIEKALKAEPRLDHRHRIEHCALVDETLIRRIKKLGIVPVAQPVFFYEFGDGYMENYGEHRVRNMFTAKTYIDQGIIAAASSDCPVTTPDPIIGLYITTNRITQSGQAVSQEERIGILDALRMYTINGAYASFDEKIKGSLEPGKLADLVILSQQVLDCPVEEIRNIKVEMTVIDGKVVFEI